MKVGVYYPDFKCHSAFYYAGYIQAELSAAGVEFVPFSIRDPLPDDVDLYWDFRALGGNNPYPPLSKATKPVVVTVHDAAPFAMALKDIYPSFRLRLRNRVRIYRRKWNWRAFHDIAAIITVSRFAEEEIKRCLNLRDYPIFPIYHGVNHELFKPAESDAVEKPYLLHISHYQPLKNVDRIIAAYSGIQIPEKPDLVLIDPGYEGEIVEPGVRMITKIQTPAEIAKYYQGAMGFVFPSLRESSPMEIYEALACGCPIITSNNSGCKELAGNAALLVDPYSVQEIQDAMSTLIESSQVRSDLRAKALERAGKFSWKISAQEHLEVFSRVIENADQVEGLVEPMTTLG
jgi:glycosyltransferase involved in cell wall biosynthesis